MNDEEVTPMQQSLDEAIAPSVPMMPVPRAFGTEGLAHATPGWSLINTTTDGMGWHLVRRSRGRDRVVTLCGVGGRKVVKHQAVFQPCPDCLITIKGE